MGDGQGLKDFFDLDMKDRTRSSKPKETWKDLIRVVYAPVLLLYRLGVEKQLQWSSDAVTAVAEEDVQVVRKTTGSGLVGAIC